MARFEVVSCTTSTVTAINLVTDEAREFSFEELGIDAEKFLETGEPWQFETDKEGCKIEI